MGHSIQLSKKMSPKTPEERNRMSSISYALAVGSIMSALLCTRPNVAYTLGIVSRFQTDLREDHLENFEKYTQVLEKIGRAHV